MMWDMGPQDEFAEFDTDESTFDAMMAHAEPAEIVARRTVTLSQEPVWSMSIAVTSASSSNWTDVSDGPPRLPAGHQHRPDPLVAS